jgi:hypothetical protein
VQPAVRFAAGAGIGLLEEGPPLLVVQELERPAFAVCHGRLPPLLQVGERDVELVALDLAGAGRVLASSASTTPGPVATSSARCRSRSEIRATSRLAISRKKRGSTVS